MSKVCIIGELVERGDYGGELVNVDLSCIINVWHKQKHYTYFAIAIDIGLKHHVLKILFGDG